MYILRQYRIKSRPYEQSSRINKTPIKSPYRRAFFSYNRSAYFASQNKNFSKIAYIITSESRKNTLGGLYGSKPNLTKTYKYPPNDPYKFIYYNISFPQPLVPTAREMTYFLTFSRFHFLVAPPTPLHRCQNDSKTRLPLPPHDWRSFSTEQKPNI